MQGLGAHCRGMWGTPGAVLARIRALTLQGAKGAPHFWVQAIQVLGQWVSAPWVGCGGYRHCSKSLQSEPCKKDQRWEGTAPAVGTTGRHLGWQPSYSMSSATCEVPKGGQMIPTCPGGSQTATACLTINMSPKSRAPALASAVLPC